jgi:hypothetical protein
MLAVVFAGTGLINSLYKFLLLIFKQMKKIFFLMLTLLIMSVASMNAQVRIGGTDNPNTSAILDLNAADGTNNGTLGLSLPRVELTSTGEPAPLAAFVKGMTVYNTFSTGDVTEGTYYCDGVRWVKVRNSTERINKSDLSAELANLIVALAKAGVPGTTGCPTTVEGSNGTYAVGDFGAVGCWMIDNSKEGTPSAKAYMEGLEGEKPEGLAGYYYTWENAQGACPTTGWSLPTREQYASLRNLLQVNNIAFGLWVLGGTQITAYAGDLRNGGIDWGNRLRTWSSEENYYETTTPVSITPQGPEHFMMSVRCVKN